MNNRLSGWPSCFPALDLQAKSNLILMKKHSLVTLIVLSFMNEFEISNEKVSVKAIQKGRNVSSYQKKFTSHTTQHVLNSLCL